MRINTKENLQVIVKLVKHEPKFNPISTRKTISIELIKLQFHFTNQFYEMDLHFEPKI